MSELDEKRRKSFLSYIKDTQVIITCTDKMELDNLNEYKLFNVKKRKNYLKTFAKKIVFSDMIYKYD